MVASGIGMDDHGLPRTPAAFIWVTMVWPWVTMDDHGFAMVDGGSAADDHGW